MIRMFSFRFSLFLLLAVIMLTQSCSIEKRRYRSGFHVERYSLTRPQTSEKTTPQADSSDASAPASASSGDPRFPDTRSSAQTEKPVRYDQFSIRESAHVPDTFIVEETKDNSLTPKQRVKYLLKNNKDPEGLAIVPNVETAYTLMLIGWGTTIIFGFGPLIALISLIFLLIAYSKLRNAPEGTYSPDNYLLIRRTFWSAFICIMLPILLFTFILLLIFL
jgi:hypothetical protein